MVVSASNIHSFAMIAAGKAQFPNDPAPAVVVLNHPSFTSQTLIIYAFVDSTPSGKQSLQVTRAVGSITFTGDVPQHSNGIFNWLALDVGPSGA